MVAKRDLTYQEWSCLLKLYRSEDVALPGNTQEKFLALGLTGPRDGTVLSVAGRKLVEHELLMERRNRLQR